LSNVPLNHGTGQPVGWAHAAQARPERLVTELRAVQAAQAQAAALTERTKLAREVHDILAHSLAGFVLALDVAGLTSRSQTRQPMTGSRPGPSMRGMTRDFPTGDIRVSDAERDRAIAELSEHFQTGRLTREEFDDRSGLALRARTGDDLLELFTDLPGGETAPEPTTATATAPAQARGADRLPVARIVIGCVIASIVIGNVTGAVAGHGVHQANFGWIVPVVIMLIVLRRICRR
jgi:hypothetical protein